MKLIEDESKLDEFFGKKPAESKEKKDWKPMVFFNESEKGAILAKFETSTDKSINAFLRNIILKDIGYKEEK